MVSKNDNVGDSQRGGVGADTYLDFAEFIFWTHYAQLLDKYPQRT
jgi:hypothetical protein